MSETITNYLDSLRNNLTPEETAMVKIGTPEQNAKGHIDQMYRVASKAGGFVAYFVVNNTENDGLHDEQHSLFCQELGIDESMHARTFPISVNTNHITVLKRTLQVYDDETVHGIYYEVDNVAHDRD